VEDHDVRARPVIYTQQNSFPHCNRRGPCYTPTCSVECRRRWAERQLSCLLHVIRESRRQGLTCYVGNANFGRPVSPTEFKKTLSRLGRLLKPWGKWRYYAEPTSDLRLHVHIFVLGRRGLTQDEFSSLWHTALGEGFAPRTSSVHFDRLKKIGGATRYVTGLTTGKKKMPLFRPKTGIRITGGSLGFFGMELATLYRQLMHVQHTRRLAESDPYILDDPRWERYSTKATEAFEADRYGRTVNLAPRKRRSLTEPRL
jgi:hypothetical protein